MDIYESRKIKFKNLERLTTKLFYQSSIKYSESIGAQTRYGILNNSRKEGQSTLLSSKFIYGEFFFYRILKLN